MDEKTNRRAGRISTYTGLGVASGGGPRRARLSRHKTRPARENTIAAINLPPELGLPSRTFGPDRTVTLIGFGMAGVLAALAVIFLILTTAKDPPAPIPHNDRWRYAIPAGLIVLTGIALMLSWRSWGHRVYICPNGIAGRRNGEVQSSLWTELVEVICSRGEPVRLETDHLRFTEKIGRGWTIQGRDVREFRELCDLLRAECDHRGVPWKPITIST